MAGGARGKMFTQEFMDTNFGQQHSEATKKQIKKGGYPDLGNGVYADKLSYLNWFNFNVQQRIHKNFLESVAQNVFNMLLLGLFSPYFGLTCGILACLGRVIYQLGYARQPKARVPGFLISMITLTVMYLANLTYLVLMLVDILNIEVTHSFSSSGSVTGSD